MTLAGLRSYSFDTNGVERAFLYDDGEEMQDLGVLSGGVRNFGYDINDNGWVTGASHREQSRPRISLRWDFHDGLERFNRS